MKNSITKNAYAKINLGLDVLRKREDGYHEVRMIMQSIQLYDRILIEKTHNPKIRLKTNLSFLPIDQGNLVYRAAKLFKETFQIKEGLQISLRKTIPVSAGLAGGSTDAAATLRGLNELFETNLSLHELMDLGVTLGADVPYCIMMGTALSEGIGEKLTPLTPMPNCYILLVKPAVCVSTKYVYQNLKLSSSLSHPNIDAMLNAIQSSDIGTLADHMENILESVTLKDYPVIDRIKGEMTKMGAKVALMSGSGPTVFGIFERKVTAEKAYHRLKSQPYKKQIFLTKPYWPVNPI